MNALCVTQYGDTDNYAGRVRVAADDSIYIDLGEHPQLLTLNLELPAALSLYRALQAGMDELDRQIADRVEGG